mmetsp:Transcript_8125/g.12227  ORF Transcript_8125/g.12227 Transcript_8125/m.12227 type:complete len:508 (+) Transcript_8125:129-1652(+)
MNFQQNSSYEPVNQCDFPKKQFLVTTSSHLIYDKVLEGFRSLKGSPSELWLAYILKFLDSYSYFSFSLSMTLFLSNDFGYDDLQAGTIYGAWGSLVVLFGLTSGPLIDKLGVATSLKLGFIISFVARCLIFYTSSRVHLLLAIMLLSFGNCLGIPVLSVGIRRYTNEENRGFAFGLFYVIMNVAVLLSGPTVDLCTVYFTQVEDEQMKVRKMDTGVPEWNFSGYRLIILVGIISNAIAFFTALLVKEIKVSSPSKSELSSNEQKEIFAMGKKSTQIFQPDNSTKTTQILRETMQSSEFWRFLAVCIITVNVRMLFRHMDATLPKYMVREFGDNVRKGLIYSINPAIIMVLVPIVSAATTKVDPLLMISRGSCISAFSVCFLVVSTSVQSCILFVIFLSIGEALWSPRLYDYTMKVAKEGREGTYMALASAPLFLAKLPVGMMSGFLLEKYCPEEGPRDSKFMWLIIGLTTAPSPILLRIFWKYLSKQNDLGRHATTLPINNHKSNVI